MLLGREPGRIEAIHGLSFVYFQVGRNGIIIKRHDLEVLDIARLVGIQDGLAISQHPLGPPVVFGVRIKNLLPSQGVHDILAFDVHAAVPKLRFCRIRTGKDVFVGCGQIHDLSPIGKVSQVLSFQNHGR